jgi:hypothetical protein
MQGPYAAHAAEPGLIAMLADRAVSELPPRLSPRRAIITDRVKGGGLLPSDEHRRLSKGRDVGLPAVVGPSPCNDESGPAEASAGCSRPRHVDRRLSLPSIGWSRIGDGFQTVGVDPLDEHCAVEGRDKHEGGPAGVGDLVDWAVLPTDHEPWLRWGVRALAGCQRDADALVLPSEGGSQYCAGAALTLSSASQGVEGERLTRRELDDPVGVDDPTW